MPRVYSYWFTDWLFKRLAKEKQAKKRKKEEAKNTSKLFLLKSELTLWRRRLLYYIFQKETWTKVSYISCKHLEENNCDETAFLFPPMFHFQTSALFGRSSDAMAGKDRLGLTSLISSGWVGGGAVVMIQCILCHNATDCTCTVTVVLYSVIVPAAFSLQFFPK